MHSSSARFSWIVAGLACVFLNAQVVKSRNPAPAEAVAPVRAIQVIGNPIPQERRFALVIGNSAYQAAPLANPVYDARDIAESLRRCGFMVTKLENATRDQLSAAIRDFGDKLLEGGVGLFYYAGHGMQVRGKNYLIPVNADILREDEVPYQAMDADAVLAKMETARNRLNILILDACRNNPFGRSFRSSSQGLAQMEAPKGTFIAFATAPGRTASDGTGRNGLYTRHLLENLSTPGLKLEDLFKRVRTGVLRDSADQQMPWDSSSLMGDFYFVMGEAAPSAPAPVDATALDLAFWNSIKDSANPADFEAYLNRFPNGTFADLARNRIAKRTPVPAPLAPPPPSGVSSAHLGVAIQDLNEDLKKELGASSGVLITDVAKDSPADKAGLRSLDLVTHADGVAIETSANLVDRVRSHKAGEILELRLLRGRHVLELIAILAPKPPDAPGSAAIGANEPPTSMDNSFNQLFGMKPVYGFMAGEITPEIRKQYGIGNEIQGVVVTSVDPRGPAKDMLAGGDVITALFLQGERLRISTLGQYLETMTKLAQKSMVILIHRPRTQQNVVVSIPYTPQKK